MKVSERVDLVVVSVIACLWAIVCAVVAGALIQSAVDAVLWGGEWYQVVAPVFLAFATAYAAYECFRVAIGRYEKWRDRQIEERNAMEADEKERRLSRHAKARKESDYEEWIRKIREKGL